MTASRDFLCASWLQPLPSIQDSPASGKLQQQTVHGDEDFFTSRGFFSELAVVFSLEKQDRKTTNSSQFGLYNEIVLKKEEEKKSHISLKRDESSLFIAWGRRSTR